ncbi:unnamed protein product [Darwinula stevensoni]|uniref:Elongation factor 1-gamma n=1 Tax=Darwinula stevensoni TaxID=69355 RepID=A0A7R9A213_9CRUS|nr:unnamed protein product [Darwinula stevensoni]CAG0888836.1 unnamed protein product [Darwinula stevensoni]
MASGVLYTNLENFRAYKILIAASYSGADVKLHEKFVLGETNRSESFLRKFPLGKVPAFEAKDGTCITESDAIAYYVSNEELRGKAVSEQAQVIQWLSFAQHEIYPSSCIWVYPCLGIIQYNKQETEDAKKEIKRALGVLDNHLLHRTFLVTERVSLADVIVCCTLLHLYTHVLDPKFRESFKNVTRWFTTMVNQPQVKKVIGEVTLCQKMAEFDSKKFAEMQAKMGGSSGGQDAGKGGKKEKGKDKTSKKSEGGGEGEKKKTQKAKKKEEEEEAEPLDETELALSLEPKKKDPFEDFPKGTFVMDDFKRVYSNEDESKSIPYFWEKFDKENYSIWKGDYNYNDELTQVFMSCNLISGMYQRLDKMRKHAFASMCLFGENNNSTISGIWVWRGHELAFKLSEDWQIDYESYSWTKLDPDKEETKQLVKQYFSWTGTDADGRPFNQGKIFK